MESEFTDLAQRWKQISPRIVYRRTFCRNRVGGSEKHAIRYPSRACRDRAEPYTRIDIGIVRLIDTERLAIALQRWKRATGTNHSTTLGPAIKFYRRRFATLGGIRQWEYNRLAHMASHVAHGLLGEGVRLS